MAARIYPTVRMLRKTLTLNLPSTRFLFHSFPRIPATNSPKIFLLATAANSVADVSTFGPRDFKRIEYKLLEASQKGKDAVIKLMELVKTKFVEVSQEYSESLQKQIKIVNEAARIGAASQKWDELPEHRIRTDELKQQFHDLVATINTLKNAAEKEVMKSILNENHLKLIELKCKEIEHVVQMHVKEIQKLEAELVVAVRDSIRKEK